LIPRLLPLRPGAGSGRGQGRLARDARARSPPRV